MKTLNILLLSGLFFLFFGASCKAVLKLSGDYKKPAPENAASVLAYLQQQDAVYDGVFAVAGKTQFRYLLDSVNSYYPAVVVFDKDFSNYFIDFKCFADKPAGLDSISRTAAWKPNTHKIEMELYSRLVSLDGGPGFTRSRKDYYVFYFWAKFFPKKSNDIIAEASALHKNLQDRVYVASVNMDIQDSWK